ncbi:hypothetical protein B0I35DRAFT_226619 [Stachybotrys elegans]|uniref:Uncharacterized protein n=1 Tax=Stachybotrys elegans TaxID=80388 RepID=A0A8K0SY12_9HYPO|nr:hypothetical protein B0I35DRAFT_226619 [Stachybotrys elegans]
MVARDAKSNNNIHHGHQTEQGGLRLGSGLLDSRAAGDPTAAFSYPWRAPPTPKSNGRESYAVCCAVRCLERTARAGWLGNLKTGLGEPNTIRFGPTAVAWANMCHPGRAAVQRWWEINWREIESMRANSPRDGGCVDVPGLCAHEFNRKWKDSCASLSSRWPAGACVSRSRRLRRRLQREGPWKTKRTHHGWDCQLARFHCHGIHVGGGNWRAEETQLFADHGPYGED